MPLNNPLQTISPDLYLPDGWDTCWRAAKAASGSTPCWAAALGDSTLLGVTTDDMANTWWQRVRTALIAKHGLYGDFYSVSHSEASQPFFQGTAPWVVTLDGATGPGWYVEAGLGLIPTITDTGGHSPTLVFTAPYACARVEVGYWELFPGTWDIVISGALAGSQAAVYPAGAGSVTYAVGGGNITVTVTASLLAQLTRRVIVTGLDNVVHTVTCQNQSGDSVMEPHGAAIIADAAKGIGFAHMAMAGSVTMYNDFNSLAWQGKYAADQPVGRGFPSQPHLLVLQYGVNDCQTAVAVATFEERLAKLIQGVRRGRADCSVLLVGVCNPSALNSDITTPFTNSDKWQHYLAGMRRVADVFGCGLANVHARWGETPVADGLVNAATDAHPGQGGHLDIYNWLAPVLV